jgi:hypothetical protein
VIKLIIIFLLTVASASAFCSEEIDTVPISCSGTVTKGTVTGSCREITCQKDGQSITVKACDKITYAELYKQYSTAQPPKVCIGTSCIQDNGYAKYAYCSAGAEQEFAITVQDTTSLAGVQFSIQKNGWEYVRSRPGTFLAGNGVQATVLDTATSTPSTINNIVVLRLGPGGSSGSGTVAYVTLRNVSATSMPTISSSLLANANALPAQGKMSISSTAVTPVPAATCSLKDLPATCTGGSIVTDTMNGCRTIACSGSSSFLQVLACEKSGYFEMYKQQGSGSALSICVAGTCLSDAGYARSTSMSCSAQQPVCYNSVLTMPVSCSDGTITADVKDSCRRVTCTQGSNSMSVLACNKPSNTGAQYFEVYKQSQQGTARTICFDKTCISSSGYVKSANSPICG